MTNSNKFYWSSYPFVPEKYVDNNFTESWRYRVIYDETEFSKIHEQNWAKKTDWKALELRQFDSLDDFSKLTFFCGSTPCYKLEESGFKREARVDLLGIRDKICDIDLGKGGMFQVGSSGIVRISSEDLSRRGQIGTTKLLFSPKNKRILSELLEYICGKELIVYRTYRAWPAMWDCIEFYSIGNYYAKQAELREKIKEKWKDD